MGVGTVAVYSDADMNSMFVKEADEAYRIGPPPSSDSYLRMDTILEVVKASGAQAVHPGYGFLSENALFPELLAANGVTFIGPPTAAIVAMGDKIESKKLAQGAGVSTVPGYLGEVERDEDILRISNEIGYPVMIKASAGGGGKGMRIAFSDREALEGFKLSKEEAISSFGDGRIFIEKYVEEPRHIEFQILGDTHGNYLYLPERECSVQRRNQKVIEEAPSPAMDPETRHKMGTQAVQLAKACGYTTTGTVEFLMDKNKDFYFLEMNTRLQVEHPITEEITGVDLVEQQLRIAAGHALEFGQDDVKINGHSLEYRVYAEDPARKFLPSIGFLRKYKEPRIDIPGERVRIDTGVEEGSEISMYYDPMISKLITWGKDREEATRILHRAFDEYVIQGVTHNIGFGRSILNNAAFAAGDYNTDFIPRFYPDGFAGDELTQEDQQKLALVAHQHCEQLRRTNIDTLFVSVPQGDDFKVESLDSEMCHQLTNVRTGEVSRHQVQYFDVSGNALVELQVADKTGTVDRSLVHFHRRENDGIRYTYEVNGNLVTLSVFDERQFELKGHMPEPVEIDSAKVIMSPMPGAIVEVFVAPGDRVVEGQQLCIIEAMKMQNILKAERAGTIEAVTVKAGDSVAVDELLIQFE
jgi:propionyl-CoA carboxylase alpha chain